MKVNRKQTFVFRRCDLVMLFFINYLKNTCRYVYFGWCFGEFSCKKKNLTVFLTGLTGRSKKSRPDRPVDPTGFHLWFGQSGSGRENPPASNSGSPFRPPQINLKRACSSDYLRKIVLKCGKAPLRTSWRNFLRTPLFTREYCLIAYINDKVCFALVFYEQVIAVIWAGGSLCNTLDVMTQKSKWPHPPLSKKKPRAKNCMLLHPLSFGNIKLTSIPSSLKICSMCG